MIARRFTAILGMLAFVLAAGVGSPRAADKVTLRIASFTPERSLTVQAAYRPFMAALKKELGEDAIAFQEFYGGTLGRDPAKQFALVRDGIADIAFVVPGYTPGQFPGFGIFELPYLIRDGEEGAKAVWRMFQAGHLKGFGDVRIIAGMGTDPYGIHTKVPIASLADLKDKEIRISGPVLSDTVAQMGAVPIGMPVTQLAESLSRGVVQGAMLGFSGVRTFRLGAQLTHHYIAPLGMTPFVFAMNKRKWDSLPDKVKAAIGKIAPDTLGIGGGRGFQKASDAFAQDLAKSGRHTFIRASAAEIAQGRERFRPVHEAWIARTEGGQAMYDALLNILADIRAGK